MAFMKKGIVLLYAALLVLPLSGCAVSEVFFQMITHPVDRIVGTADDQKEATTGPSDNSALAADGTAVTPHAKPVPAEPEVIPAEPELIPAEQEPVPADMESESTSESTGTQQKPAVPEETEGAASASKAAGAVPATETPPDSSAGSGSDAVRSASLLSGRIICIDPGHCVTPLTGKGYTAPVSPLSDERKPLYTAGTEGANLTEEKLNLIVGLKLRDALEAMDATVLMTREVSEITVTSEERTDIANSAGADANIHIHADGVDDISVHGVSVLVPGGDLLGSPSIVPESRRLGKLMVDAVAQTTGAKNRGIVTRSDLSGFNFSEVPTVMIEMGFMTNPKEDALLETDDYQNRIVEGMVLSLLQWYGLES